MNPIANIPVFLGLVEGADKKSIKIIARNGTITAFIIVAAFIFFGKFIFDLFNITIPAFKIAGGILLFQVGFEMLQSKKSSVHSQDAIEVDEGVAISPLAIPILAGPGTIVTAMNYVAGVDFVHIGIVTGCFALVSFLTYLAFSASNLIVKIIGRNLIAVVGKIMGLILTIMGAEMLIEGIKLAFNIK
jgi:multiple antibiotic resistance protein